MKKLLAMTAAAFMVCSVLTGCGDNDKSSSSDMEGGVNSGTEITEDSSSRLVETDSESRTEEETEDYSESGSDSSSDGYVGDVVDGVESAGEDIVDGVGDAADDIISGIDGDDDSSSR